VPSAIVIQDLTLGDRERPQVHPLVGQKDSNFGTREL